MDYKKHIENLKQPIVKSAVRAIDFLDGKQLEYVIADLDHPQKGIKFWRTRGVLPIFLNLTEKIITRSALTYQGEPERTVYIGDSENEDASMLYNDLLGYNGYSALNQLDIDSRLLKTALIIVQYSEKKKKLLFNILHRGNCDIDYDHANQEIISLVYTSGSFGPDGGQMLYYWDNEVVKDIEMAGDSDGKVINTEANTYGIIPVAIRYDISPPRSDFWPKMRWEELIRANEVVNRFHIEAAHASHVQMFPALFTNAELPDGVVIGADAIIGIGGRQDELYLEYKTPVVNIEAFKDWLSDFQESIADNWGVNLKVEGSGDGDSGFKLTVEETWNLELRKQRQKSAAVAEEELFEVIKILSNKHGLGIPEDSKLYIEFPEPKLAVDANSEREQDRADIAAGIMSVEEVWRKNDPSLSDEDIAKRKKEVAVTQLPDFKDDSQKGR